jgi:hypothetical protein
MDLHASLIRFLVLMAILWGIPLLAAIFLILLTAGEKGPNMPLLFCVIVVGAITGIAAIYWRVNSIIEELRGKKN